MQEGDGQRGQENGEGDRAGRGAGAGEALGEPCPPSFPRTVVRAQHVFAAALGDEVDALEPVRAGGHLDDAPAEPPVPVEDEGPANVLVVQNRHNPATPHRGGELIDEKVGDRSRLVSLEGSGHGAYVVGGNACALNTTTSFLVAGTLPRDEVTCG
ncbi:hypothetical protein GCM10027445_01460 [Amycolatopsis endophytica]|uniref:Peptidase S33 tripeptidyl aminopeptidase-like C-terminal domain-containing protein n=1 Tax=Amycolatopsis endophytica TaxID=860233 RepID=A0A853B9N8_9PSEU|nr:alpha/beta hydrolase [Amycolatopsis endophytica]NYI91515.1 hypothetical protein [Amycolatopsis endophytica]